VEATGWFRFLGQNVKGTPSMPYWKVAHDVRVIRANAHIAVLQEFRWPWYWRAARAVLRRATTDREDWGSSPPFLRGRARPVAGAQAVLWRESRARPMRTKVLLAHEGERRVSESRYWRAILLDIDATGMCMWAGSGHPVVKGDQNHDEPLRRRMMATDLDTLDDFLADLVATGHPGMMEADMNIRPGGWAYLRFREILKAHGCRLVGPVTGVEYLWCWHGTTTRVEVDEPFQIPTTRLYTDHEGRGARARLVARP
jgi:hypothetical protein